MSIPAMNAVLPPAGAPSPPNSTSPLSLTVTPVKPQPSSPVAKLHHNTASPISLVHENKPKTPEKPKESYVEVAKVTSNGVDNVGCKPPEIVSAEPTVPNILPTPLEPEVSHEATVAASEPEPVPIPAPASAPSPTPAPVPPPAPAEPLAPAPTSVPSPTTASALVAEPLAVKESNHPASSVTLKKEDAVSEEKLCDVVKPKDESPKAKPQKPQKTAKRRREAAVAATSAEAEAEAGSPEKKVRRHRAPVSPYQCPLPEITTVIKHSLKEKRDNSLKASEDKLIVFYKNEFLAVRNAEGSFYLCQTMQNIYRTSHKIRIRWLSRDEKESTKEGGIFTADFYDNTDFECILTTVALDRQDKNKYKMPAGELERVESILKRALDVEKGVSEKPDVTAEHPDGLDLSLYNDESQLQKKAQKRKRSPSRKKKSPKRAKKVKKAKGASAGTKTTVVAAAAPPAPTATSKSKPIIKKPPAKRVTIPPPTLPEKSSTRAGRSLARDKIASAVTSKVADKVVVKIDKQKPKAATPKKKKGTKALKPEAAKTDKKPERNKGKTSGPSAVAASSSGFKRGSDKKEASVSATSDKRPTRKRAHK